MQHSSTRAGKGQGVHLQSPTVESCLAEKDETDPTPCTFPTQSFNFIIRFGGHDAAPCPYRTQSCESIFAPCLFSLSFDVCSFVGEALSPP